MEGREVEETNETDGVCMHVCCSLDRAHFRRPLRPAPGPKAGGEMDGTRRYLNMALQGDPTGNTFPSQKDGGREMT